jgi:selenocysteine lyase/cysteine desulfurase
MSRFERFLSEHPAYAGTAALDELRRSEYGRLDAQQHVYLDYTGGGLHAASQVRDHAELLNAQVFGNPHSASPSSTETTQHVERARAAVLDYFGAAGDYTAVFTPNASGALKLVAEAYPFECGSSLLMTADNHNSVNGMREFARAKGAHVDYAAGTACRRAAMAARLALAEPGRDHLLAFPAQSNFSGVKHPLALIGQAQAAGWQVLLDAAAFVPTNRLDLRAVQPDFVTISFYKMFGYPTGVGGLLIRKTALPKLRRPWFAGGTVASPPCRAPARAPGEAGFEDGTLNYLGIPAVEIGLRHLGRVGIDRIQTRVRCLTGWLLTELLALRHGNGRPMVRLYGPATTAQRGGTVTMNFYDPEGRLLDYRRLEELAGEQRISLRTGCFCNPGAGETAEGLTEDDMRAGLAEGDEISLSRFVQLMQTRGAECRRCASRSAWPATSPTPSASSTSPPACATRPRSRSAR